MTSYDFSDVSINEFDDYIGHNEWNAVYTIQLGELIANGIFDWNLPILNWKSSAYNDEQYTRVCNYFIERFYYREISIEPFEEWRRVLLSKIIYELMPKYKPLYERLDEGINPLSDENEYLKRRAIDSAYPETLLSGNSDYVSDGHDEEYQRIKEGNYVDAITNFNELYKNVDVMLLDELESMFITLYTTNVNATW